MSDGSLYVVIEFMPPSWVPEKLYTPTDLGPFQDFDRQMERAIGTPVYWEDREFFLIRKPQSNTVERIQKFLQDYRRNNNFA